MATQTAVIVVSQEAILICAIPPLLPQPPDFSNHNPTHIPPLFTIPFPDDIAHHPEFMMELKAFDPWYFGSTSLYFDMFFRGAELYRFQIILKPDLSAASLHVINSPKRQICPRDFTFTFIHSQDYRICEDTTVSCWFYNDRNHPGQYNCGVCTGLNFTRFTVISHGGPAVEKSLPDPGHDYRLYPCPASGRFVLLDIDNHSVVVFDFF
jgi:hypothetical protein